MLIRRIEKFLRDNKMSATKFGRLVARDPRFVLDLRNGREPRGPMEQRVDRFIREFAQAGEGA